MTIIECMFSISPIPKPGDNNDSIIYNYMLSHKERRLPLVMKGPDSPIKSRAEGYEGSPHKRHDMVIRLHAAAVQNRSST